VKKTAIGIGVLMTASMLAILFFLPVCALTVRLPREDHHLAQAARVSPGDTLDLSYLHSVERTQVVGRFTVGPDRALLATETRMTSVGTGLPNCEPDRTRRQGDWIVVDEGNQKIPGIRFYYADVNQTRLIVAGRPMDLDALRSGSLLLIDVETPRLYQWGQWIVAGRMWSLD
jgi:hypothetical protein